ncbi:DHBP synthase RibB-like alpha/beta domain-containing protein [Chytridium lagenaria]|nr:DHBP synthase RibB-like alpha/beta domain-containing protein [Chytridium lagenaria]
MATTNGPLEPQTKMRTEVLKIDPASFPYPALTSLDDPHIPPFHLHDTPPTPTYDQDLLNLQRAATALRSENHPTPIAFPTETVYGLGANATSDLCIRSIFHVKGRPSDNPLIVHISSLDMLKTLLPDGYTLPSIYRPILEHHWPGPLTILLPRGPSIPASVTAGHPTVAIRMPSSPIARALIDQCGFPIAAPSANTSGRPSPTVADHVLQDLNGKVPIILDGGEADGGVESTVLDGLSTPPAILRPGGVTVEQLRVFPGMEGVRVYKKDFVDSGMEAAPVTPGMKYRHYSPRMEVVLFECGGQADRMHAAVTAEAGKMLSGAPSGSKIGVMRTTRDTVNEGREDWVEIYLGDARDPATVAHNLFSGLRRLEEVGVVAILVEGIEEEREGLAVMNRLRKAASRIIVV